RESKTREPIGQGQTKQRRGQGRGYRQYQAVTQAFPKVRRVGHESEVRKCGGTLHGETKRLLEVKARPLALANRFDLTASGADVVRQLFGAGLPRRWERPDHVRQP